MRFVAGHLGDVVVIELVDGQALAAMLSGPMGAFGHSSGGLAATALCQAPAIVGACINMDGRLDAAPYIRTSGRGAPSRPFLDLTKPFRPLTEAELKQEGLTREEATRTLVQTNEQDLRLLAKAGPPAYRVIIQLAAHESFSDEPLLRDPGNATNIRVLELIRRAVRGFFDSALAPSPGKWFEMPSSADIQFTVVTPKR